MQKTPPDLIQVTPEELQLGEDHVGFLKNLRHPTQINISGDDHSRCRAIVTLLHGNEPSGLKAVHRLLKSNIRPATDLTVIIACVNTALQPPMLSQRFLPWEEDMNRCFKQPFDGNQGLLARAILNSLRSRVHEAVVDAHNTSAHSEPFVVSVQDSQNIRLLSTLFADNLVIMDQTLGTLIDHGDHLNPWITIEFGGLMDPGADQLAYESLRAFVSEPQLFNRPPEPVQILHHPLRLEISEDARIHYSSSVIHNSHITMFNTIDQLNFQLVKANTPLGWVSPEGLSRFYVRSNKGDENILDYFYNDNGFFTTTQPLTLFMATTDPYIAVKDCLLYLTPGRRN